MPWQEAYEEQLLTLPEVLGWVVADEAGLALHHGGETNADEFAGATAFIARNGRKVGDLLGVGALSSVSGSGKKDVLMVRCLDDSFVGLRLKPESVRSKVEGQVHAVFGRPELE